MNWVYHINDVDSQVVDDQTYQDLLSTGIWFATPTAARAAAICVKAKAREVVQAPEVSDPELPRLKKGKKKEA